MNFSSKLLIRRKTNKPPTIKPIHLVLAILLVLLFLTPCTTSAESFLECSPYTFKLKNSPSNISKLAALLDRLYNSVGLKLLKSRPRIKIYSDYKPDAFFTTSEILLSTGLLNITESEDQLAFILAHELGHYLLGHSSATNDQTNSNTVHSLADEVAADYTAIQLIQQLGYQPTAAINVLHNIVALLPQKDLLRHGTLAHNLNFRFIQLGNLVGLTNSALHPQV